jgi:hypothetical protein
MRLAPACLAILLPTLLGSMTGCHQHHYYYNGAAPCGPTTTQLSPVPYGAVCEVPADGVSSGTVINQAPVRRSTISNAPAPRVVVSQPATGASSRRGWHRTDPESLATTRVEGAIDGDSLQR